MKPNIQKSNSQIRIENIKDKILILRNRQVLLDSDVAEIYAVETKRINEAVVNNPEKFPTGYVLELNTDEWENLKSKFSTSSWGGKRKQPKAFTEKGLYMLATILKSPQAIQTTIDIVETFAQFRELARTVSEISNAKDEKTQKSLMQKSGEIISDLIGDELATTEDETTIELNFAVLKLKHTIKRKKS
ncbi:MAG: ORF6N domain-containing protein [Prevotellaceae bacterium]|jgi:hypothetical protein|nr:ORF6N domain-containing protein [Prevotellaceae bacterium]